MNHRVNKNKAKGKDVPALPEFTLLTEPIDFTANGLTYSYSFDHTNCVQCELAREVLDFRMNTLDNPPAEFKTLIKSRAAYWLFDSMGFVLVRLQDGIPQRFNFEGVAQIVDFLQELGSKELNDLRRCALDFFIRIGKGAEILRLLQSERKKDWREGLIPYLAEQMSSI